MSESYKVTIERSPEGPYRYTLYVKTPDGKWLGVYGKDYGFKTDVCGKSTVWGAQRKAKKVIAAHKRQNSTEAIPSVSYEVPA